MNSLIFPYLILGVPTSTVNSTQQWDYPNCWPPLQAMVIQGLDRTNYKPAQTVAINLAKSWINTNYVGYVNSGTMFEKVISKITYFWFFYIFVLWNFFTI